MSELTADMASKIVESIVDDLTDRRGLRHEWDGIDEDIQKEIMETWATIVQASLDRLSANGEVRNAALETATEMPMNDCGLTINTGRDGTWLHFKASTGKHASLSVDVMAEDRRNIIAQALKDWCADRQGQASALKSPPTAEKGEA